MGPREEWLLGGKLPQEETTSHSWRLAEGCRQTKPAQDSLVLHAEGQVPRRQTSGLLALEGPSLLPAF